MITIGCLSPENVQTLNHRNSGLLSLSEHAAEAKGYSWCSAASNGQLGLFEENVGECSISEPGAIVKLQ